MSFNAGQIIRFSSVNLKKWNISKPAALRYAHKLGKVLCPCHTALVCTFIFFATKPQSKLLKVCWVHGHQGLSVVTTKCSPQCVVGI